MRILPLLAALFLLTGCENKDEAYKKSVRPLYDAMARVRDDVKSGVIAPSFSADCDAAKSQLDKARQSLSAQDAARTSFVNMEGALEGYILLRSISSAPPEKIKLMADGAAADLEKAKRALDNGD